jgi:hypothetical protein
MLDFPISRDPVHKPKYAVTALIYNFNLYSYIPKKAESFFYLFVSSRGITLSKIIRPLPNLEMTCAFL